MVGLFCYVCYQKQGIIMKYNVQFLFQIEEAGHNDELYYPLKEIECSHEHDMTGRSVLCEHTLQGIYCH